MLIREKMAREFKTKHWFLHPIFHADFWSPGPICLLDTNVEKCPTYNSLFSGLAGLVVEVQVICRHLGLAPTSGLLHDFLATALETRLAEHRWTGVDPVAPVPWVQCKPALMSVTLQCCPS